MARGTLIVFSITFVIIVRVLYGPADFRRVLSLGEKKKEGRMPVRPAFLGSIHTTPVPEDRGYRLAIRPVGL